MTSQCLKKCPALKNFFFKWAQVYTIEGNALSALLKILNEEKNCDITMVDSTTLLKTVRKADVLSTADGSQMSYFGLVKGLRQHDLHKLCGNDKNVAIKVNIHGLPISKSSGGQFWPVLCQIVSQHPVSPFLVACYYGKTKPKSIHEFLEPFVKESATVQF